MSDGDDIEADFLKRVSGANISAEMKNPEQRGFLKQKWLSEYWEREDQFRPDEELRSTARRLGDDILKSAKDDLSAALEKAGASPKKASRACSGIASQAYYCRLLQEYNLRPFDEIGRLRETLAKLDSQLRTLSGAARSLLGVEGMPTYFALPESELEPFLSEEEFKMGHFKRPTWGTAWESPLVRFERALPQYLEALPITATKRGGRDAHLHEAIEGACFVWHHHTGVWPSATITDNWPTAPLYAFLYKHVDGISPTTWSRILRDLKKKSSDSQESDAD